jgi:hypothetical protein
VTGVTVLEAVTVSWKLTLSASSVTVVFDLSARKGEEVCDFVSPPSSRAKCDVCLPAAKRRPMVE